MSLFFPQIQCSNIFLLQERELIPSENITSENMSNNFILILKMKFHSIKLISKRPVKELTSFIWSNEGEALFAKRQYALQFYKIIKMSGDKREASEWAHKNVLNAFPSTAFYNKYSSNGLCISGLKSPRCKISCLDSSFISYNFTQFDCFFFLPCDQMFHGEWLMRLHHMLLFG